MTTTTPTLLSSVIKSPRILRALSDAQITTLDKLLATRPTDLPKHRQIGRSACERIKTDLAAIGIQWCWKTERERRYHRSGPYGKAYPIAVGYVYLIYSPRMRAHKVGFSEHPKARLLSIRSLIPDAVLVHSAPESARFEEWMHGQLSKHHVMREWFELPPDRVEWFTSGRALSEYQSTA